MRQKERMEKVHIGRNVLSFSVVDFDNIIIAILFPFPIVPNTTFYIREYIDGTIFAHSVF